MKIGIVGGGQLGRMLAMAAHRLDVEPVVLDPKPDCPAAAVARTICAPWDDEQALDTLAQCPVVTYEFENIPVHAITALARRTCVRPGPVALRDTSDRLREKHLLRGLGFSTTEFAPVDSREELEAAVRRFGVPTILKTRRFGYDGRGQARIRRAGDVERAWRMLGDQPLILEKQVNFDHEASIIAVRSGTGEIRMWDPTRNVHVDGILRVSQSPALELAPAGVRNAKQQVADLLNHLDYVGVAAVEFFVWRGEWIANEVACRVHNSGHWTLDGAVTDQFENHVRAVVGLPLGSTRTLEPTAMLNLVGELPRAERVLRIPGARLHSYGKTAAPGRKLGHINVTATSKDEVSQRVAGLASVIRDAALDEALGAA